MFARKKLSSKTGFIGIARKGVMLLIVSIGHVLDTQVFGGGGVCRSAVVGFYIANEGLSVMENTSELGVPWPPVLDKALRQLKHNSEENKDDE